MYVILFQVYESHSVRISNDSVDSLIVRLSVAVLSQLTELVNVELYTPDVA